MSEFPTSPDPVSTGIDGAPDTFADPGASSQPPAQAPGGATAASGSPGEPNPSASVPSYRLREETERRTAVEQQLAELRQSLAQREAQLQGVLGFTRPDPANAQAAQIRAELLRIFPELRALENQPNLLAHLAQAVPAFQESAQVVWNQRGQQAVGEIRGTVDGYYQELGAESAPPEAKRYVEEQFERLLWSNPQAYQRYVQGDPTLITEFWSGVKPVLDSVRRYGAVRVENRGVARQALPTMARGPSAPTSPAPVKPVDEDELHAAAWNAFTKRK